jgi:hypothetical protein
MIDDEPELRAERLRILLALFRGAPTVPPSEVVPLELLRVEWSRVREFLDSVTDDDLTLANEILNFEHEYRQREYAALERLLTHVPSGDGSLDTRLQQLPMPEFAAAAYELVQLGWIDRV